MPDPGDNQTTVIMVGSDGTEVVVGHMDAGIPDLRLVDGLMRWQLLARRSGCSMLLRGVSDDLRALLEFAGLDDVLALEPRRQPELGEQLRVDEVVEPRDPPV